VSAKNSTGAAIAAVVLGSCALPQAGGELCVYTARSPGQFADELPLFLAGHPQISLRCRGADEEDLYCPTRVADPTARCTDQDAEDWVVVRRSTGSLTALLAEEGAATRADVVWGLGISHLWHFRDNTGLLRPYEPAHYDRVFHAVTSGRRGTLWTSFIEPEVWDYESYYPPTAVGMDAFAVVFCVDPEKVKDRLPGWDGTLTWEQVIEHFEGEVTMPNPAKSGSGFVAIAGIREHFRRFGEGTPQQREEATWAFLRRLDAAVTEYTTTGDGPCDLVARGESTIGITHDAADRLPHGSETPGPEGPLRVFPAPDPGHGGRRMLGYDVAASAVIEHGAATKPAALELLDWTLSPEAMAVFAEQTPLVAYDIRGTPLPAGYPGDFFDLPDTELDFNVIAAERAAFQTAWTQEFCAGEVAEPRCYYDVQ
jgi:iron(III) transport system substrate-binding protein